MGTSVPLRSLTVKLWIDVAAFQSSGPGFEGWKWRVEFNHRIRLASIKGHTTYLLWIWTCFQTIRIRFLSQHWWKGCKKSAHKSDGEQDTRTHLDLVGRREEVDTLIQHEQVSSMEDDYFVSEQHRWWAWFYTFLCVIYTCLWSLGAETDFNETPEQTVPL